MKPAFVIQKATKEKQKASAQFECGKRAQLIDKGDSLWSNVINVLLRETRLNHGKVTQQSKMNYIYSSTEGNTMSPKTFIIISYCTNNFNH